MYALLMTMNYTLGMAFLGPASLLPLITDDYDLSGGFAGFIAAGMTVMVTLLSIPVGVLAVRWGLKRPLAIGWLLVGTGVLVPLIPGAGALALIRLVQGCGAAALPLTAAVLMRWAPVKEFALVNSAGLACLTAGTATSLVIGPPLADVWSWQGALAIEGGLAVMVALCWIVLAREGPVGETRLLQTSVPIRSIFEVFRLRSTWLLAFAVTGLGPYSWR
jgi:MFS family permease